MVVDPAHQSAGPPQQQQQRAASVAAALAGGGVRRGGVGSSGSGGGGGKNNNSNNNSNSSYNRLSHPRWRRYCFLLLSSLIQCSAVVTIRHDDNDDVQQQHSWLEWAIAVQFGVVLFVFSGVSLCTRFRDQENDNNDDANKKNKNKTNGRKECDPESTWEEGYWLVAAVLYSLVGAAMVTRVGAMGYVALNVYFGTWLTVVAAIATLNQWSTDRDILSIDELTSISFTLKSWWTLLLTGIIAAGTAFNFWLVQGRGLFGVAMGSISACTAAFFIATHYNLLKVGCAEGGWAELFAIVALCILWTIATAVITQESGIGATIAGTKRLRLGSMDDDGDCVVLHHNETISCLDWITSHTEHVPGSNLYLSSWISLLAAFHLVARWKAQQALQFADARQQQHETAVTTAAAAKHYDDEDDDDDDDGSDSHDSGRGGEKGFEDASISRDSL
jgi:hypothetical protein